jgi:hypothetical protein
MSPGRAEVVRCAGCAEAYAPGAWIALAPLRTLTHEELSSYVVGWSRERRVEVRVCHRCGHAIARLVDPRQTVPA